ncbi:MAG: ABC transporter ATP-binding protein [Myxococcota bacterium]
MSTLRVTDLSTHFFMPEGIVRAVDRVSFSVEPGESVGLVGESGSGKTVASLSVLGLVDSPPGRTVGGSVEWDGRELLALADRELRHIRGRDIAMVFQEPMSSLNPVYTVGEQVAEVLILHEGLDYAAARARVLTLLKQVGIPDPGVRIDDYPHQMSGGMKQRVMIAMALACGPRLLIADEPTTSLDVTVQAQILELLDTERRIRGMGLLLISHDLAVVAERCDRVVVMYAGRVVEAGPVERVLTKPRHPYTSALLRSLPERNVPGDRLETIPGSVPPPLSWDSGCRFRDRCSRATDQCAQPPPMADRNVWCWHPLESGRG